MRITIGLIVIMICHSSVVLAQVTKPDISDREQCDSIAKKLGSLKQRYSSRQFYLGCLVAGSVQTLLLESQMKSDAAKESFSKSTKSIPAKDFVAALRNAEAQSNIAIYAAQYALDYFHAGGYAKKSFPEKDLGFYAPYSDDAFQITKLANIQIRIGNTIHRMINVQYDELRKSHLRANLAYLKSRLITLKYCESLHKRYRIEKRDYAERSFLFPQSYQDIVFACAGVGVNFYDLLFSARMNIKDKRIMQHMCEAHPKRWGKVCEDV
ncbi:MAG: hypothetical protein COB26_10250 [Piscirickettsiaceae bacterium]|nr:MAG: hypothetical protein COB26_10250 [Piscirickettsiaceae bacterium]